MVHPVRSARRLALAALLALVAPSGSARAEPNRDEAQRLKDLGAAALARGDLESALRRLEEAYRAYPSASLKYNLGVVQRKLGRYDEAFRTFEELE